MSSLDEEFRGWRLYLWPVKRSELKKFLPLLAMLFLICFSYSVLRNLKDTVVITAHSSDAAVIPFIKVGAMLPSAILITYLFTKLSNRLTQEKVFYVMVSFFLSYFVLFVFFLYPNQETLHFNHFGDWATENLPEGFKGLIAMFRNWTFTGFYVMCELWCSMVLSVLFWGFANQITALSEAKRFYSTLAVAGNIATICAGKVSNFFGKIPYQPALYGNSCWEQTLVSLVSLVVCCGLLIILIFYWMNNNLELNTGEEELESGEADRVVGKKKKKKMSLRKSFSYLFNSRYLLCIAVLVISYNLVINIVEVVWKDQLKLLHPDSDNYSIYMNNVTIAMGIISVLMSFFIPFFISRFGWTKTAQITPFIMLSTGVVFFTLLLYQRGWFGAAPFLFGAINPLSLAVFVGAMQNSLSKGAKYSIFDATREMTFIPLNQEARLKAKAAIDGVGSRFGKSGGSIIHITLFMICGSIANSTPYLALIVIAAIIFWMFAVNSLGKRFQEIQSDHEVIEDLVESDQPEKQKDLEPASVT